MSRERVRAADRSPAGGGWHAVAGRLGSDGSPWLAVGGVAALLGVAFAVTYLAGGTSTVLPHLFYVPIMVAALLLGFRGGVATALAATLLCGPLMPLDVAEQQPQLVASWLSRGVFFVTIGSLAGGMLRARRRSFERELAVEFEREVELASRTSAPSVGSDGAVRAILAERRFRVAFQPIYALADGHLTAVEALTRFADEPGRGPAVWFDAAHRAGVGTDLELAAIELALEASTELSAGTWLAVNCSPSSLTDPRFGQLLSRHPDRRVTVEVTEHAVVDDYAALAEAITALRERGVRLAIDDVGAGISSLRHIVRLEPDVIKLDISLTQHLRDDPVRRALADCLIEFATRTGSELVAEGIEDDADLATWRELGAAAAQGYLLGRPAHLLPAPVCPSIVRLGERDRSRP